MALTIKDLVLGAGERIMDVPGPPTLKDRKGERVTFRMRVLSEKEIRGIREIYTRRTIVMDKRGVPHCNNAGEVMHSTEVKSEELIAHLLAASIVEPELLSKETREELGCTSVQDVVETVFSGRGEYQYMIQAFNALHGGGEMPADGEEEEPLGELNGC